MQYQETFRSVRKHKQVVSTTGKWEKQDYVSAAACVGLLIMIGVGGRIALSLGLGG